MDHREAIFGECLDDNGEFDLGGLAERLLLFERVTLRSNRLTEIPILVRAFGVMGLTTLLNQGALRFDSNAYGVGNFNPGGKPRAFAYDIRALIGRDQNGKVERFRKSALDAIPDLRKMDRVRLEKAMDRRRVEIPEDFGVTPMNALARDLAANSPMFHAGALLAASEIVGMKIRPGDLTLKVHVEEGTRCTVENNLMKIGLDEERAHKVIEGAILAVAGTETKLAQMKSHESVCLFREEEVPVVQDKIRFALEQWHPQAQVDRLGRVLEVRGLPDFGAAVAGNTLDFARLIEARESPECLQFRQWLRSRDSVSDEEIRAEIESVRTTLGTFIKGDSGKLLRWIATCAAGLVASGLGGFVAGAAASAVDAFLLERVLPYSGPIAFLNKSVRSIVIK